MLKLAAIIGGVLLMGGVAFAGTRTLLEQTSGPTLGTTLQLPAAPATTRQEDRGRENEVRGRENEVDEDLRGPCDEPEHANDPPAPVVALLALAGLLCAAEMGYAAYVVSRGSVAVPVTRLEPEPRQLTPAGVGAKPRTVTTRRTTTATATSPRTTTVDDHGDNSGPGGGGGSSGHDGGGHGGDD